MKTADSKLPTANGPWTAGLKRSSDLLISALLLVMLAPILGIALLCVWLTMGRPLFFSQTRSGKLGQPFTAYKIRTMSTAHRHDPREMVPLDHSAVTPVGRWLRRLKLDELPQIWNVLTGEMSLVGPRPTIPEQTQAYDEYQRQRLWVRPGLTGLAQVNGNAAISWDERIKYDVHYVHNLGFRMDLGIGFKTLLVVVLGEAQLARPFSESPYCLRHEEQVG